MLEKNILIDWFQFTYFGSIEPFVLFEYLGVPRNEILIEDYGLYRYKKTYSWRDIKIFTTDVQSMGTHVLLSGKGCRDIEELGINWLDFLQYLFEEYSIHVSRIDIAIDIFSDKYFTIKKIRKYIKNNLVVSKFKSTTKFEQNSLSSSNTESETIWFGSRVGNIQIVFYNKLLERKNASYEVRSDIKHWYRVETRLRNEAAYSFLYNYFKDKQEIPYIINDILYSYLDFKDKGSDSNRCRWTTSKWWLEFLETNKKLKLDLTTKESDIVRKKEWLKNIVSKTEFMVFCSSLVKEDNLSIDMLSSDYIYNQLKNGYKSITHKDLELINEYRQKKHLLPLESSDLSSIIDSVKSLLI